MGNTLDTFKDCLLEREQYANTIISLIKHSFEISENNSLVIALDSPWGTGKSVFARMLENKIMSNNENEIFVVTYNAWQNDYCKNAFNPLFYDIISHEIFEGTVDVKNIKKFGTAAVKIAKAFAMDVAEKAGGKNTVEAIIKEGETFKNFMLRQLPKIKELEDERNAIENFKKYLSKTIEYYMHDKKLLIIIDELDRCKPLFAIKTLEIIKHLFDIPQVCFLLAVDFEQLKHSIATVYGQGMDSEGYLRRFANYVLKLPEPSINNYIEFLRKAYPLLTEGELTTEFIEDMKTIFNCEKLSLRDINSIYENFRLFFISRFNAETQKFALPYLFIMIQKYKNIDNYNSLLSDKSFLYDYNNNIRIGLQGKYRFIENLKNGSMLDVLVTNKEIFDYIYNDQGKSLEYLLYDDVRRYDELKYGDVTPARYMAMQIELFTCKWESNQGEQS